MLQNSSVIVQGDTPMDSRARFDPPRPPALNSRNERAASATIRAKERRRTNTREEQAMSEAVEFVPDPPIRCRDYRIGAVGAGFIMADVHLASYKEAGFPVVAIASRTPEKAREVAARWG